MKTRLVSPSKGMDDLRRGILERGFWYGLIMGAGAISYFGYTANTPLSYPRNGSAQDLHRIGSDMYAGLRNFNEKTETQEVRA